MRRLKSDNEQALNAFRQLLKTFNNDPIGIAIGVSESIMNVSGGNIDGPLSPMYRKNASYVRQHLLSLTTMPQTLMKFALDNPHVAGTTEFPIEFMGLQDLSEIKKAYLDKWDHPNFDASLEYIIYALSSLGVAMGSFEAGDGGNQHHPGALKALPKMRFFPTYAGVEDDVSKLERHAYATLLSYQTLILTEAGRIAEASFIAQHEKNEIYTFGRSEYPNWDTLHLLEHHFNRFEHYLSAHNQLARQGHSPYIHPGLTFNHLGAILEDDLNVPNDDQTAVETKLNEVLKEIPNRLHLPSVSCRLLLIDVLMKSLQPHFEKNIGTLLYSIPSTLKVMNSGQFTIKAVDPQDKITYLQEGNSLGSTTHYYLEKHEITETQKGLHKKIAVHTTQDQQLLSSITLGDKDELISAEHGIYYLNITESEPDTFQITMHDTHLNKVVDLSVLSPDSIEVSSCTGNYRVTTEQSLITVTSPEDESFMIQLEDIHAGIRWYTENESFHLNADKSFSIFVNNGESYTHSLTIPKNAVTTPTIVAINTDPKARSDGNHVRKDDDMDLNEISLDLLMFLFSTPPTRFYDKEVRYTSPEFKKYMPDEKYTRDGLLSIFQKTTFVKKLKKITMFLAIKELKNHNEIIEKLLMPDIREHGYHFDLNKMEPSDKYLLLSSIEAAAHYVLFEMMEKIYHELSYPPGQHIFEINAPLEQKDINVTKISKFDDVPLQQYSSQSFPIMLKAIEVGNLKLFKDIVANDKKETSSGKILRTVNVSKIPDIAAHLILHGHHNEANAILRKYARFSRLFKFDMSCLAKAAKSGNMATYKWVWNTIVSQYRNRDRRHEQKAPKYPSPNIDVLAAAIQSGNITIVNEVINSWRTYKGYGPIDRRLPDQIYSMASSKSKKMFDAIMKGFQPYTSFLAWGNYKTKIPDTTLIYAAIAKDIHFIEELLIGTNNYIGVSPGGHPYNSPALVDLLNATALQGDPEFFKQVLSLLLPSLESLSSLGFTNSKSPFINTSLEHSDDGPCPVYHVTLPYSVLVNACRSQSTELIEFLTQPETTINDIPFQPLHHTISSVHAIIESGNMDNIVLKGVEQHLFLNDDSLIAATTSENMRMYEYIKTLPNIKKPKFAPRFFANSTQHIHAESKRCSSYRMVATDSKSKDGSPLTFEDRKTPERKKRASTEKASAFIGSPDSSNTRHNYSNSLLCQERMIAAIIHNDNDTALNDALNLLDGPVPMNIIQTAQKYKAKKCLKVINLKWAKSSYIDKLLSHGKSLQAPLNTQEANQMAMFLANPCMDPKESSEFAKRLYQSIEELERSTGWLFKHEESFNRSITSTTSKRGIVHSVLSHDKPQDQVKRLFDDNLRKRAKQVLNNEPLNTMSAQKSIF